MAYLCAAAPAQGRSDVPGAALDRSFGVDGQARLPASGRIAALSLAPSGAMAVVGNDGSGAWALRRTADGAADPVFAGGRPVSVTVGPETRVEAALALADGTLVLGGRHREGSADVAFVARLRADGAVDGSFGEGGVRRLRQSRGSMGGQRSAAYSLRLAGGRLLVELAGLAVARLELDGDLDAGFGDRGIASAPLGRRTTQAAGLAVRPDGGVTAVASYATFPDPTSGLTFFGTVLAPFDGIGQRDRLRFLRDFQATSVGQRSDEEAVVAGFGGCGFAIGDLRDTACGALLGELHFPGSLRSPFGLPPASVQPQITRYSTVVRQRGGGVLALGATAGGSLFARRFGADGEPTADFGGCGTRIGPDALRPRSAAEDARGRTLIAGVSYGNLVVARWTARASRTGSFGQELRTVLFVRENERRALALNGLRVKARFSAAVRFSLRLRVAGFARGDRTRIRSLDRCEILRVRLKISARERARMVALQIRRQPIRIVLDVSARDRRGRLLLRQTQVVAREAAGPASQG